MATLFIYLQKIMLLLTALMNLFNFNTKPETVTVDLYANPSSGYVWEYDFDNDGILIMTESKYTPDAATVLQGRGGGTRTFKFRAVDSGTVRIKFNYVKTVGGKKQSVSQYIYTYDVDRDKKITLCSVQQLN